MQEPFCILKTGEFIFFPDYTRKRYIPEEARNKDLHKPYRHYNPSGMMWGRVKRSTTKLTNGKSANEELKAIFEGLHPTEYDYHYLDTTESGTVQPRNYLKQIRSIFIYKHDNYNTYNEYSEDRNVVFEGIEPLDTEETIVLLDFESTGQAVFRVYNNGAEIARVNKYGKIYIPYNKEVWAEASNEQRFRSLTKTVKIADMEKYQKSELRYAVINFDQDLWSIITEIALNQNSPYEQLMKTDYAAAIREYLNISNGVDSRRIETRLATLFGLNHYTLNAKTLYQKLNVNKYQFNRIMNNLKAKTLYIDGVAYARYFMSQFKNSDQDVFLSLDNEQFDTLFDFCNNHFKICWGTPVGYYSSYTELYSMGIQDFFKMMKMMNTLYSDLYNKYNAEFKIRGDSIVDTIYEICWRNFVDYYSMRKRLLRSEFIRKKDAPIDVYNLYNRDEIGFQKMHDKLIEWTNLEEQLRLEETTPEWDAQYTKWKELEYMNNQKGLCVVAPINQGKLVNEGKALHHCVAGYIERVTKGITNILFIRKTSEKDTPYFTVEVQNGLIKQIHGSCNCNPNREVLAFVRQWAKAKDLRLGNYRQVLG